MTAPTDTLAALAHEYWEGVLRRNPVLATFLGDYRYNDRLPDVGPAGRAQEEAALTELFPGLPGFEAAGFVLLYASAFPEEFATGPFLELALVTATLYLLMSYPLSLVTRRLEKKSITARA